MKSSPLPIWTAFSRCGVLSALLTCAALLPVEARDWHLSGSGRDTNDGATPATALRTLKRAADLVQPGDTVLIGNGTYVDSDTASHSALVTLSTPGRPDAWITWKAAPGAKPDLRPTGWNGIRVVAPYQIVDGLTLTGANDSIKLSDAHADGIIKEKNGKKYTGNPRYNTNAIFVTGREQPADAKPHHVIIRNCTVAKFPGGGLTVIEADYVTLEDNLVFENCWFMRYAGSGITFLNNWAFDDKPGYHNVIQRNLVWDNKTLVPWINTGKLSDGNGILLDVTNLAGGGPGNPAADVATNPVGDAPRATTTPTPTATAKPTATPAPTSTGTAAAAKPKRPEWKGRTLIANNVSAYNGGSGIHTFKTAHADIVNNTTCMNGQNVGYPEIFANRSDDVIMVNNVMIPRPNGKVTANTRSTNVRWDYNLYPVEQDGTRGSNDIIAYPKLVRVGGDLRKADFRLAPGSPGLGDGTPDFNSVTVGPDGQPRPPGQAPNRGAYQN